MNFVSQRYLFNIHLNYSTCPISYNVIMFLHIINISVPFYFSYLLLSIIFLSINFYFSNVKKPFEPIKPKENHPFIPYEDNNE